MTIITIWVLLSLNKIGSRYQIVSLQRRRQFAAVWKTRLPLGVSSWSKGLSSSKYKISLPIWITMFPKFEPWSYDPRPFVDCDGNILLCWGRQVNLFMNDAGKVLALYYYDLINLNSIERAELRWQQHHINDEYIYSIRLFALLVIHYQLVSVSNKTRTLLSWWSA